MAVGERYVSGSYMDDEFPFFILRCLHDRDHTPQAHSHDFVELVYVASGGARHLFEGGAYELRAGDVFIINPGEEHTYAPGDGQAIEIINCLFQPHLLGGGLLRELEVTDTLDYFYIHPFLHREERFNHLLNLEGDEADRALEVLETMMRESMRRQLGYRTLIRLRMVELLTLLSRQYAASRQVAPAQAMCDRRTAARRICGYLERHYRQKITLPSLAGLFHLSVRQLNRIFREEMGVSVVEKIQQIRVDRAKQLLACTDEKIIAVAAMVGYEDPAFFSRLFTREVGLAPGRYRARAAGGAR